MAITMAARLVCTPSWVFRLWPRWLWQAKVAAVGGIAALEVTAMSAEVPAGARLQGPARPGTRPDTVTARVAGTLFIAATVASLLSTGLLNPVFSGSGYLLKIAAHQDRIVAGAFFEIIAAFASAGIALSLYPVVRKHGEALALGSVGFRLLEGGLYLVAAVGTLLLLQVGRGATAGSPIPSYLRTSGALLLALRNQADLIAVLAFYVGASMYYSVFYRARLVPRWLSGWDWREPRWGPSPGCWFSSA
jgi:hypothetical protein